MRTGLAPREGELGSTLVCKIAPGMSVTDTGSSRNKKIQRDRIGNTAAIVTQSAVPGGRSHARLWRQLAEKMQRIAASFLSVGKDFFYAALT